MDEREFNDLSEQIFARIERSLEANHEALDCERLAGGNLEITCPDDSVMIINRHAVNREIWVAARAGGHSVTGQRVGRYAATTPNCYKACALLIANGSNCLT